MHRGLCVFVAAALAGCASQEETAPPEPPRAALLGLEARAATSGEKKEFALGRFLAGRVNGLVVASVAPGGPAEAGGVRAGDALLSLDENRFYSADDLADFVRAAAPGQRVKATVMRAASKAEEVLEVTLGSTPAPEERRISWTYAGPAQLQAAFARAKSEGKRVMVGISGAET